MHRHSTGIKIRRTKYLFEAGSEDLNVLKTSDTVKKMCGPATLKREQKGGS